MLGMVLDHQNATRYDASGATGVFRPTYLLSTQPTNQLGTAEANVIRIMNVTPPATSYLPLSLLLPSPQPGRNHG
jgi:hypothetical protein